MYAYHVFFLSQLLEQLHQEMRKLSPAYPAPGDSSHLTEEHENFGAADPLFPLSSPFINFLNKERKRLIDILQLIDNTSHQVSVDVSHDIKDAVDYINLPYAAREIAIKNMQMISNRIIYELREHYFFHIGSNKANYFHNIHVYDNKLLMTFPAIIEDLKNAGSCYAVDLHAACVFHLMRVMEHSVQRFGDQLGLRMKVTSAPWSQIMVLVHKGVESLPAGAKATNLQNNRRQCFAVAARRLDDVRLAWQSDAMLPTVSYSEQEALHLLVSVKAFLESIVELV
jgi:hypothetical protein